MMIVYIKEIHNEQIGELDDAVIVSETSYQWRNV